MTTLLFLHGWGTSGRVWQRQLEGLKDTGAALAAPTLARYEVSWLAACLSSYPLSETIIVGWSLGGMLLLEALPRLPAPPRMLVLVAVPPSFCPRPDHPFGHRPAALRALRRLLHTEPHKGLADFARRCLAPGERDFLADFLQEFRFALNGAGLAAGLDYLLRADLRPFLPQVRLPVLILQGEEDVIVPPVQAEMLHRALPGSRLVLLPGAGHAPFYTQAAKVNALFRGMLRSELIDHVDFGQR